MLKTAMLLNPTIKSPIPGERKSQLATSTIESTHNVESKQSKGTMYLIDKKAPSVKHFVASCQAQRELVYSYSFPWGDTGLRLSTAKAFPELSAKWNKAKDQTDQCAENFFVDYSALKSQAEFKLGALYDESQYPSISELRRIYKNSLEVWPLPDSGHFVADIAQEAADAAKANIEQTFRDSLVNSFKIMSDKSEKLVSKFIEKCESYGKDPKSGKMQGIFRDTLITNIAEQAELIRNLNFTNEPGIETLATHLDRLAKCTGDALRDDDTYRSQKVGEAKSLMAKLDSFRKVDTQVDNLIGSVADYY